jgi:transcriptional regulator with XRE-family HTH domain
MGTKQRPVDVGSQRGRRIIADLGMELRRARQQHGLSQTAIGRAAGISPSQVSRIERGLAQRVSIHGISKLLAVVGLELSARAYPGGEPIRDAAHRALLDRFRALVDPSVAWRFEVPIGPVGDLRAWDALMLVDGVQIAVEAETRPDDVQVLQRRVAMKRRDDARPVAVVLLLSNTRHNRILVRDHGEAFRADLPEPGARILEALSLGRRLGGSGIVLV